METDIRKEHRQHLRVIAKSIIVSLTDKQHEQQLTGFLKDISEGGMKIQKISAKRQVEKVDYLCEFVLPESGKISVLATVLGSGYDDDKFSEHLIRMKFLDLDPEQKEKILRYIAGKDNETETTD